MTENHSEPKFKQGDRVKYKDIISVVRVSDLTFEFGYIYGIRNRVGFFCGIEEKELQLFEEKETAKEGAPLFKIGDVVSHKANKAQKGVVIEVCVINLIDSCEACQKKRSLLFNCPNCKVSEKFTGRYKISTGIGQEADTVFEVEEFEIEKATEE